MFRRKPKFDRNKLKTSLKMAKHRLALVRPRTASAAARDRTCTLHMRSPLTASALPLFLPRIRPLARRRLQHYKKMDNDVKVKKKAISLLLTQASAATDGKRGRLEEKVMIRVESLIRDEHMMEANELIELFTETVEARLAMISASKTPPADTKKAICSIVYASTTLQPTCEELIAAARQFEILYGPDFIRKALANDMGCADERVVHKLSIESPSKTLVVETMTAIADEYPGCTWAYGGDDVGGGRLVRAALRAVPAGAANSGRAGGPPGPLGLAIAREPDPLPDLRLDLHGI